MKKVHTICCIGGDGIGPEVTHETMRLLDASGLSVMWKMAEAGYAAFQKYDTPLPEKTIQYAKKCDAILFGAVTTPPHIENYSSPIVQLRKELDLFANVRPFFPLPGMEKNHALNCVIIRENTEGLYSGKERRTSQGALAERIITKSACERIVRFAFEYVHQHKRKKVTLVHKANVLRLTDGLFLTIGKQVATKFPHITFDDMLVDSCAMNLIRKPENFEVIVTTNMFGDILSDEAAGLSGGLGVAPSANIGVNLGLFEPVHGSAPKYAGKNRANPVASFLSGCLMLEFLHEKTAAQRIRKAVFRALEKKQCTPDLGGTLTTSEFTDVVIGSLT